LALAIIAVGFNQRIENEDISNGFSPKRKQDFG
jgi:hypothetical protein